MGNHLTEIFVSKRLPDFSSCDWLSDENVLCIFNNPQDAKKALTGCLKGFDDAETKDDVPPGPGLWRAQRSMLEFREATVDDKADPMNKRQHRAGRQVREFRFWGAITEQSKTILAGQEYETILKRLAPSGEDAMAAAEFDDFDDVPPAKKRRVGMANASEEEGIDLLEEMASLDKKILVKAEG